MSDQMWSRMWFDVKMANGDRVQFISIEIDWCAFVKQDWIFDIFIFWWPPLSLFSFLVILFISTYCIMYGPFMLLPEFETEIKPNRSVIRYYYLPDWKSANKTKCGEKKKCPECEATCGILSRIANKGLYLHF